MVATHRQLIEKVTMHGPAVYRIRVQGALDPDWASRLEGMNVTEARSEAGEVETILVGRLQDQAALSSVLNAVYELHLPILSAECLEGR
jgi:hypothetical protein